jgi:hypothetical protein
MVKQAMRQVSGLSCNRFCASFMWLFICESLSLKLKQYHSFITAWWKHSIYRLLISSFPFWLPIEVLNSLSPLNFPSYKIVICLSKTKILCHPGWLHSTRNSSHLTWNWVQEPMIHTIHKWVAVGLLFEGSRGVIAGWVRHRLHGVQIVAGKGCNRRTGLSSP